MLLREGPEDEVPTGEDVDRVRRAHARVRSSPPHGWLRVSPLPVRGPARRRAARCAQMSTPDSDASFWDRRYGEAERLWSLKPNALLAAFAATLEPGRALDVGAGEGRNAIWLAQRGWSVTALDVSGVALGRAAQRAAEENVELECVEADWREYRPAVMFELVVISFMHPEPHERSSMFGAAREMLVPGGYLFVVGVDLSEHGHRGPPDADRLYTPERLREALEGLDVLRCETTAYEAESRQGFRRVVDVVGIARLARPPTRAVPRRGARSGRSHG